MKLIDILVQELPKRGGWPEGAEIISMHADGVVYINKKKHSICPYHNVLMGGIGINTLQIIQTKSLANNMKQH